MGYLEALWHYLNLSAPYLLLGLFFSGLIHSFISVENIKKWLGNKSFKDIIYASAAGVPLPLCSCSVIPAAVTLKKAGASNSAVSSFLISTPESGIDSMAVTYALIDLPMTIIRPVAGFFSGILAGVLQLIFNLETNDEKATFEPISGHKDCCGPGHTHKNETIAQKLLEGLKYAFNDLINDLALWLSIGILAGALIDYMVPADFFSTIPVWQSKALIFMVGIPLYICASATTPIAASMIVKGMSPGTALILLLVGPATNFSNIAVLQKYIGKKGVILNIIAVIISALIFSYLTDYLYSHYFEIKLSKSLISHEHQSFAWWEISSSVILSFLILRGIYIENIKGSHKGHSH